MFGAKYSRLKFWIISIILFIPMPFLKVFAEAFEEVNSNNAIFLYLIISLLSLMWINTLANRIRDYGSNPWISLFVLIPIVNILLAFYYGIVKSKKSESNETNNNTTLSKAVYNHSKDIASEIKPSINEYKQKHSSSKQSEDFSINISEDEIYEQVMIEIEEDKKVKSTWAKALAQSDGNKDKAESLYIKMRVNSLKIEYIKQETNKNNISLNCNKNNSINEELILNIENQLNQFMKKEGLFLIKHISKEEVLCQYNNGPMEETIIHENGEWKYKNLKENIKVNDEKKELTKEEKNFLASYHVNEYSKNIEISPKKIIVSTSSGKKEYHRG